MRKVKHICIDLELEQGSSNPQTPDSHVDSPYIIQAGWVIYEVNPFKLIKTRLLHRKYDKPLSEFIKKLTKIKDEDVQNGISLEEIYKKLIEDRDEFNCSRIIAQWGSGDIEAIKQEINSDDWVLGRSGLNVKHLYQCYAEANEIKTHGGLSKSMSKCGLFWNTVPGMKQANKHNALVDAYNTAIIHNFLIKQLKHDNKKAT